MFNSFKKYGGINVSATNNIVKNNYTSANNLLIPYNIGLLNSKINSQSHLDMSNNSILNINTLYFSNGTTQSSGTDQATMLRAGINFYVADSAGTLVIDTTRSFGVTRVVYVATSGSTPGHYEVTLSATSIPTLFYINGTGQIESNPYSYTGATTLANYTSANTCVVTLLGVSGNICKIFVASSSGSTKLNTNGFLSIQMFY